MPFVKRYVSFLTCRVLVLLMCGLSTSVVKTLNCSHDHSIPILSWDKIHHGDYPVSVLKNVYDFM